MHERMHTIQREMAELVAGAIATSVALQVAVAARPLAERCMRWVSLRNCTTITISAESNRALFRAVTMQLAARTAAWYKTGKHVRLATISYDDPDGTRVYCIPEPGTTPVVEFSPKSAKQTASKDPRRGGTAYPARVSVRIYASAYVLSALDDDRHAGMNRFMLDTLSTLSPPLPRDELEFLHDMFDPTPPPPPQPTRWQAFKAYVDSMMSVAAG